MSSEPRTDPNDAEAGAPARGRAPRRWLPFAIGGGLAAVVVIAWAVWYLAGHESTDDARIEGHVHPVAARVGGTVLEVRVHDNQRVVAGDVLVVLDPKDFQVALARAQADLGAAEAAAAAAQKGADVIATGSSSRLAAARSTLAGAAARLSATRAREREAAARADQAEKDRARFEPLLAKDEVSHQEYDAATAGAIAAAAARDAAAAAVEEAARGVDTARAELAQAATAPQQTAAERARAEAAKARAEQAKAAVDQARARSRVHPRRGAGSRRGEPQVGRDRPDRQPGPAAAGGRGARRRLGHGELQGDAARGDARGPARSRCVDAVERPHVHGGTSTASPPRPARSSACCPPENATATTSRSSSACRSRSCSSPEQDSDHLLRPGMSVAPTVDLRGSARTARLEVNGERAAETVAAAVATLPKHPWIVAIAVHVRRRSWRCSTRPSSTCRCRTSRAACRRPSTRPRGC